MFNMFEDLSSRRFVVTKDKAEIFLLVNKMPWGVDVNKLEGTTPVDKENLVFIPSENIYKIEQCYAIAEIAQKNRANHLSAINKGS